VIPPANTGNERTSKKAVTIIAHKKTARCSKAKLPFLFKIVVIKLIEPTKDEIPAV